MQLATVLDVPSRPRKTPLRPLAIDPKVWDEYGAAAPVAGTTRPDGLREFIDWVRDDPQLWGRFRQEAERRGETMRAAVHRALLAYLDADERSAS